MLIMLRTLKQTAFVLCVTLTHTKHTCVHTHKVFWVFVFHVIKNIYESV